MYKLNLTLQALAYLFYYYTRATLDMLLIYTFLHLFEFYHQYLNPGPVDIGENCFLLYFTFNQNLIKFKFLSFLAHLTPLKTPLHVAFL